MTKILRCAVKSVTQALFFVDPKFSTLPEKTLREKAEASLKDPPGVPVSKKQKALKIILKITNIAAAAGAGAAICAFIK